MPDIASVDAFKQTLITAKSVAYIDPASGGSSGIYVEGLLERLGIADTVKPKAKLKKGGYVAELIANGEAEIGLHQISEILPVKGVKLVGTAACRHSELHDLRRRSRRRVETAATALMP